MIYDVKSFIEFAKTPQIVLKAKDILEDIYNEGGDYKDGDDGYLE